ncbi:MAG: hypothetical protein ACRCZ3_11180 [Providencia rustigianii]|uniref:hypothetical protein n=1 Tax=Providencia rustigianii TaxID=158850 RepID=UPI003F3397CA
MPTVLFFVLLGMATAHFIYEKILLPSIRLYYRNKLFELRDKVRNELIDNPKPADVESAKLVHEVLNNSINRLHLMTIQNQYRARKRFVQNEALQLKIKKEVEIIKKSESEIIIGTIKESAEILNKLMFFNSFMLFLYTFPVFILIALVAKIVSSVASRVKRVIMEYRRLEEAVMVLPDRMIKKLLDADVDLDIRAKA